MSFDEPFWLHVKSATVFASAVITSSVSIVSGSPDITGFSAKKSSISSTIMQWRPKGALRGVELLAWSITPYSAHSLISMALITTLARRERAGLHAKNYVRFQG